MDRRVYFGQKLLYYTRLVAGCGDYGSDNSRDIGNPKAVLDCPVANHIDEGNFRQQVCYPWECRLVFAREGWATM